MQKRFFLLFLLIFSVFLAGCINLSGETNDKPIEYAELQKRIAELEIRDNATRPTYFGSKLTQIVFQNLPPLPGDFYKVRLLIKLGKFTNLSMFGPEYWAQPEFYPEFETQGIPLMQEPPAGRFAGFGYGTYPSEIVILTTPGSTITTTYFIHTSWLVQTYQGVGFEPTFPTSGNIVMSSFPDENKTVIQNSSEVRKYFDVEVTPKYALLEPAFPIISANWTKKVDVTIHVKPNAPKGRYIIGVDIVAPPDEQSTEWLYKYQTNYVAAGSTSIGVPWYSAFIEVR